MYFPICLDISNRKCVLVGGGAVAERKALSLLAHGARLKVISPELTSGLLDLEKQGRLEWVKRSYREGDLSAAFLVIAATDDPDVQKRIHSEADKNNTLLNVADVPEWCNFILPATMRRGDLSVSISTDGRSPALARKMRKELEEKFGDEYSTQVKILGAIRSEVLALGHSHDENKSLFHKLVDCDMLQWIRNKDWQAIEKHIQHVLGEDFPLDCLTAVKEQNHGS